MESSDDKFPATRWSVVAAARSSDPAERSRALDVLFAAYWKPVYKYVRLKWNRTPEDAQDLTQSFFTQLLERDLLLQYSPDRSKLRTYLRLCADSFVLNEDKSAQRQKRGGGFAHVPLDFEAAERELGRNVLDPAAIPSPESLEEFFEKEWIRSLFALAVEELRKFCEAKQKLRAFEIFDAYDLDPQESISYELLSQRYEIPTTDVTNSLAWARREFRRIALEKLKEICGTEDEFRREALALFGWNAG